MTPQRRKQIIKELFGRDGNRCVWCSQTMGRRSALLSLDHVLPQVHGGSWFPGNLLIACRNCNSARNHTDVIEWAAECCARGQKVALDVVAKAVTRADDPRATADGHMAWVLRCQAEEAADRRARRVEREARQILRRAQRKLERELTADLRALPTVPEPQVLDTVCS